jgi:hypothetical protein
MKRPFRPTRGRRVLAWTFAVFAVSQLAAGLLLDNCWPLVRFDEARQMLKRYRDLYGREESPDVIVLGTSRFLLAIQEDALTGSLRRAAGDSSVRAFNASVAAGDLETSDYLLNHLLSENAKPRLLVLEVSPETLNQHSGWINYQIVRFLRWQDYPRSFGQIVHSGNPATAAQARLLPLITYRKNIGEIVRMSFAEWRHGPKRTPAIVSPELVDWRARVRVPEAVADNFHQVATGANQVFTHRLRDFRVGGTALDAFHRILARCRENEIRVLLLSAPVTSFHRDLYSAAIQAEYYAFLKRIEQTRGIEFVECHASLPDTLFKDGHHTTTDGGIYFGEKLGRELLGPRWRKNMVIGQPVSRPDDNRIHRAPK